MTNNFSYNTNTCWNAGPFLMPQGPKATEVAKRVLQLIRQLTTDSQRDFAMMVGIDESTISRALTGLDRQFNDDHLLQIERQTSARFEWLKYGELPEFWSNPADIPDRTSRPHEGQLLKEWMGRAGIRQIELVNRLGKAKSTISKYFDSETLGSVTKKAILEALGASYNDVFAPSALSPNAVEEPRATYRIRGVRIVTEDRVMVQRVPVSARAGFGYHAYFNDNNDKEYVPVSEDRLCPGIKPELHAIIEINGDSMEPTLKPGFEVLVYELPRGSFPKPGSIVVIDFQDELIIKRLTLVDYVDETVTLRSDNGGEELRIPMSNIRTTWRVYDYYKSRL